MADAEKRLENRFAGQMEINYDLDRTLVSFQANKSEQRHRWCKYKEGFSAALMRYIFDKLGLHDGTLLDPFAGSGTALFVAAERGVDAVGIELLPSSAEIVEVRQILLRCDEKKMAATLRRFAREAGWEDGGDSEPFQHLRITAGAFPKETERLLGRYVNICRGKRDRDLRRVLRFAAMCVLEAISYTRKDGQYLRWDSRSGRRAGKKKFDKGRIVPFTEAIQAKLREIAEDISPKTSLFDELPNRSRLGSVSLQVGSCLDCLSDLLPHAYEGLVTSPPYCNRYDYTRTYALELAWLGVGEEAIKTLRQAMLSCTVENREKDGLERVFARTTHDDCLRAFHGQEVLQLALEYLETCRDEGVINNTGIPRMVRNYFKELALVIFECHRVLKHGAPFVMVNDNVRYQGAHIPVDLILSDLAERAGYEVEAIWVLPKGKGNSSQQMGQHGRKVLRKCVYVWRATGKPTKKSGR